MKKLIMIFGSPGSGKHTIINKLKEGDKDVLQLLDLENHSYTVTEETEKDKKYDLILQFVNMEMDVMITLGFYSDIDGDDSLIRIIKRTFSFLDIEIVFLNLENSELLYERFKQTPWFQSDYDNNCKKFSKEIIQDTNNQIRSKLCSFENFGCEYIEIDTSDGYRIINR